MKACSDILQFALLGLLIVFTLGRPWKRAPTWWTAIIDSVLCAALIVCGIRIAVCIIGGFASGR